MEALPIFLDKLADPVTAVILSVTVVLIFGTSSIYSSSAHSVHAVRHSATVPCRGRIRLQTTPSSCAYARKETADIATWFCVTFPSHSRLCQQIDASPGLVVAVAVNSSW